MRDIDPALEKLLARSHQGVLAVVRSGGLPHLSNVLYTWDAASRVVRATSTLDRVKVKALLGNPVAAIHVAGDHFWAYAVAEGTAEVVDPTATGRVTVDELLDFYRAVLEAPDEDTLRERIVSERRVLIRLHVARVHGLVRAASRTDVRP